MNTKRIKISDVKIGDKIKSYNIYTNTVEYMDVLDTIKVTVKHCDQIKITIDGAYIITSNWHPFPVKRNDSIQYIRSDEVLVGDITIDEFGEEVLVTDIDNDPKESENFRDLTVDENNNYFCSTHKNGKLHLIHNTRAGAATVALDTWHLDIEDFLEMQTENGDQRKKAYDVFPQVVVSNLFMNRVENDSMWTLVDVKEVEDVYGVNLVDLWGVEFEKFYVMLEAEKKLKNTKTISARNLFKQIMKTQIETGMPYIFFKDTVNEANPNKHCGVIPNGNLCQESYSNVKPAKVNKQVLSSVDGDPKTLSIDNTGETHICNLVSINLATLNVDDEDEVKFIHECAVNILDNAIDITTAPVKDAENHNNLYRVIGVGYMGLHDLFANKQIKYGSDESVDYVHDLFDDFAYHLYNYSMELAKTRGAYGAFVGSDYSKGKILSKEVSDLDSKKPLRWVELSENIMKHGIRNSQLMAIAPNTSSSLMQGCTASILPVWNKYFVEKNSSGTNPVFPPHLKDRFWFYTENKNIDQKNVIDVVSTIQKWTDTGISMELVYNLNSDITAKNIFDILIYAWKCGSKAIYYTRTIQNDVNSVKDESCISCAN